MLLAATPVSEKVGFVKELADAPRSMMQPIKAPTGAAGADGGDESSQAWLERHAATLEAKAEKFVRAMAKKPKLVETGEVKMPEKSVEAGAAASTAGAASAVAAAPSAAPSAAGGDADDPILQCDSLAGWLRPESSEKQGLLVKRPMTGQWDVHQADIDDAVRSLGKKGKDGVNTEVANHPDPQVLTERLTAAVDALLAQVPLAAEVCRQLYVDAISLGQTVGALCASAPTIQVRFEIFGENCCSRWHQDRYVARAIVSYTGKVGTAYTADANVDFWELHNCGNNKCVIQDEAKVMHAEVGDLFLMKGTEFPVPPGEVKDEKWGLVHKSPEKCYHADGRIINRLVLKVDVPTPGPVYAQQGGSFPMFVQGRAVAP